MKRYLFCLILIVFFSGCTTMETDQTTEMTPSITFLPEDEAGFTNIRHVYIGMTYEEVTSIMGKQVKVGYKRNEQLLGGFEPIILKSPHRAEILKAKNSIYNVVYYFTNVKKPDGIIAEDELTPLVFKDNKLIGKGRDFLFKLKNELKNKG